MRRLVTTTVNVACAVLLLVLAAFVGLQATGQLTAAAIVSGSMDVPGGIPIGSTVLGWRTDTVQVGDVVTAHRPDGRQVTHRVVEVLPGGQFRLKGDANASQDADTYTLSAGAAVVFAVIPGYGRVAETVRTNPLAMLGIALACGALIGHALPRWSRRRVAPAPVRSRCAHEPELSLPLWPLWIDPTRWEVTEMGTDALFAPATRSAAPDRQPQHAHA